jgi:NCS1 family nucleobase:cation symporter-1
VPAAGHAVLVLVVGGASVVVAISLDLVAYENFLLLIGGVFVPLFGIFLADFFLVRRRSVNVPALYDERGEYWYRSGVNVLGVGVWALAFVLYALCAQPPWLLQHVPGLIDWAPENLAFIDNVGGTVPAFVFSFVAYWLVPQAWRRGPSSTEVETTAPALPE